jgi:hypothetical protein
MELTFNFIVKKCNHLSPLINLIVSVPGYLKGSVKFALLNMCDPQGQINIVDVVKSRSAGHISRVEGTRGATTD